MEVSSDVIVFSFCFFGFFAVECLLYLDQNVIF